MNPLKLCIEDKTSSPKLFDFEQFNKLTLKFSQLKSLILIGSDADFSNYSAETFEEYFAVANELMADISELLERMSS